MEDSWIDYKLTLDQAEILTEHFGLNVSDLEDYEICELLDRLIDELN